MWHSIADLENCGDQSPPEPELVNDAEHVIVSEDADETVERSVMQPVANVKRGQARMKYQTMHLYATSCKSNAGRERLASFPGPILGMSKGTNIKWASVIGAAPWDVGKVESGEDARLWHSKRHCVLLPLQPVLDAQILKQLQHVGVGA